MEILKVQNLCKTYGTGEAKVDALKNVSFSLEKGEFVAVVGESGSGKSTLLNCIGALDVPTSGTVTMDGNNLFSMKEEERTIFRRRNIGFIFQSFQLVSELTVEQNIAFPLLLDYRKPKASDVEEILELLGLQILSECEPNIIVITGDLVDAEHTDIDVALDFAKEAVQIADTYYVTGNHEASLSQYDELKAELENTGVVVLEDKAMQLEYNGDDITLIGLSDPSFTLKGDMFGEVPAMVDTKLRGLIGDKDNYTILLSHRPELFEAYVNCGVDLVLSGHAHGGQFRLPFIGGLVAPNQGLFPKYDAGLYTKGDTNMIVCRGLGNSIIPIRFNNRPEIVLLELIAE